ncbi:hypothetical protein EFA69_00760 [Rufibacter immobilis]|uniref:STAS/SEC14 domain-containing protein n=1 Tax=Rufibacter immobilis TaxID=1348778 RepID=A0A3M9N6R2_9BACT|nr:hypothetical protein [Rufibacter immobilis]RNI32987.1 hypothetical protein EFA69_00760 [Rufibacter immobilis]
MREEIQNSFGRTFYVIEYKPEQDFIDTVWLGYASQNDLRKACEVGLQMLEQTNCPYKLNDNSESAGPWADAVTWLEKEWLPRAVKAGLRYLAHVAHKHSYGETAGEAMQVSKIGEMLEVGVFSSREEALAWLKNCQLKPTEANA